MLSLQETCRSNWDKLPADVRQQCLSLLDDTLLKGHEHFESNLDYLRRYRENPRFHSLGGGILIRNLLRRVLPDSSLPSNNWDDYYTGAIDELLERYHDRA